MKFPASFNSFWKTRCKPIGESRWRVNASPSLEGMERRALLTVPSASILFNPPGTQESLTQTYPTDVFTTSKNAETYQLSVIPLGAVTFDKPSGVIPTGTTYSPVTITPKADSTSVNATHIYVSYNGSASQPLLNLTIASITYGMKPGSVSAHISNTDTPAGMPDRIPPRTATDLYVKITPNLGNSGQTVTLGISPQSLSTGTFTINSTNRVILTGSSVVALTGSTQTAPGYAGRLKLGVFLTGADLAETGFNSDGFSVAAIPIKLVTTFYDLVDATHADPVSGSFDNRGFSVQSHWDSDSGNIMDLNSVDISENVQYADSYGGVFYGVTHKPSGYLPAIVPPGKLRLDSHSVFDSDIRSPGGTETAYQVFTFRDLRTGANNIVMPNSGYVITRKVFKTSTGWVMTTIETGQATTANNFTSSAGIFQGGNSNGGAEETVT